MSSPSPIANGNHMILKHTQNLELQRRNGSARYSMVVPVSTVTDDLEYEENDPSGNEIKANQHQVIDFSSCSSPQAYPFVLSFRNLSYSVKVGEKTGFLFCGEGRVETSTKLLLDDISGVAREGEIMAVLGASGAGKTTFIDAIAGRIEKESLKGTVALNGQVLESRLLKVISAYVMQDDLLFPMLTVEETLMFSAEFRLPRSVSKQKKQARVQAVIDQLGLRSSAKTVIGDEGHRGVSGGERRRVSIGIDIIHDPILLFLDEPTSGLDSTSAFTIVNVLQRIARSGSIVIMSIHQPSSRIMSLPDNLIFLSQGRIVYNAKPSSLFQFFEEFGRPIPENEIPTEFANDLIRELEKTSSGITNLVDFSKSWQTTKNPNTLCDLQSVSLKDAIKASISRGKLVVAGDKATNDSTLTSSVPKFANPSWIEIIVIARRLVTNSRRMPELFGIRLGAVLTTSAILATLYWKLDDSPKGAQGRFGFLAYVMSSAFLTCATEVPMYLQERYIFKRETTYNAYRHSSYAVAHSLISIPSLITLSLAIAITTFWAVGFSGGLSGFFFFFIMIFASFWAGTAFVAFVTGLVSQQLVAFTIVVANVGYFLLFCGFFITRTQIPPYWIWYHYLSLIKYPFQGLLLNEFSDPTKCFVRGVQIFDDTPLVSFPMSTKMKLIESMSSVLGANITSSSCVISGLDILEQKGASDLNKWTCLWITLGWGIFFRVLFYFTLLFGSKNKRS